MLPTGYWPLPHSFQLFATGAEPQAKLELMANGIYFTHCLDAWTRNRHDINKSIVGKELHPTSMQPIHNKNQTNNCIQSAFVPSRDLHVQRDYSDKYLLKHYNHLAF